MESKIRNPKSKIDVAVVVRRATPDDASIVAEYAIKLIEQHLEYDSIRFSRIATPQGLANFYGSQTGSDTAAVFVAEINDRIIGFAYVGYEELSYEDLASRTAWIHDIYVDDDQRHGGAGQALIEAAINFAKAQGASKLLLWTAAHNTAGKKFFERAGFKTTMHEMMLPVGD